MALIEFEDLPNTQTPINSKNLNDNFNELKENATSLEENVSAQIEEINNKISSIIESGSNDNGEYIKFSDGTLIQRGKITYPANTNDQGYVFSFPISFKDNNYTITPELFYETTIAVVPIFSAKLVNSVKIFCTFLNTSNLTWTWVWTYPQTVNWVAIGKWK